MWTLVSGSHGRAVPPFPDKEANRRLRERLLGSEPRWGPVSITTDSPTPPQTDLGLRA